MKKQIFSIKESLSAGWDIFIKNWKLFILISITTAILSSIQGKVNDEEARSAAVIISIAIAVLSTIIDLGVLKVTINIFDKKKAEYLDIFRYTKYFWRYLGASILYGLLITAGLILLIVPGIIWALKYSIVLNLIVDKDMGVFESFKKSGELTNGVKWQLFLFGLACLGVIILGALALGVGVLIALPVTSIASVFVYRKLLQAK
jgi:uncharacterized membrane protein